MHILESACEVADANGCDGLRMSAVAAEAGVSMTTIYRWFPSKADLLCAVKANADRRSGTQHGSQ